MDLTEMMDELVIDLKMTLDTEISTTEATRCINRAVNTMSRKIPRERIYEHTWIKAVTDDSFTTPAATDTDMLVDDMDLPATIVDGSKATLTATPWLDVPRPVIITLTDADDSITRMTLVVKGTDADGVYREEGFYRHSGKVQTGKVYFSFIYEIEFSEITGNLTGDKLDVGTGAADTAGKEIWVQLDNPVEPSSEGIYSAALKTGTKYTLDTDYYMDYANGRICFTNAGSMAAATTYYANYSRASTSIDISNIIPELQRITKVLYPADKVPEQQVAHSLWENMLTIGALRQGASQEALTDKEHIAIYYEARHAPPTLVGSGSYPALLNEVVLLGAGGYALEIEALQYELAVATNITSITGALTNATKYLDNNAGADAAGLLADITTDAAELRTAMETALDKASTYLTAADTPPSAHDYLINGDDTINKLNDGGVTVPERYADYARASMQLYQTLLAEAGARLSNLRSYIEQSSGYTAIAGNFIGEATRYQEAAGTNLVLADRLRGEAEIRLAEFHTILDNKAEYRKRVGGASVKQPA